MSTEGALVKELARGPWIQVLGVNPRGRKMGRHVATEYEPRARSSKENSALGVWEEKRQLERMQKELFV